MMTKVIIVTTVIEKVIKVFNANFEKGDLGTRTMTKYLRLHPGGIPNCYPLKRLNYIIFYL